jgi:hypothetical protein
MLPSSINRSPSTGVHWPCWLKPRLSASKLDPGPHVDLVISFGISVRLVPPASSVKIDFGLSRFPFVSLC